jgi:hypothetical protein
VQPGGHREQLRNKPETGTSAAIEECREECRSGVRRNGPAQVQLGKQDPEKQLWVQQSLFAWQASPLSAQGPEAAGGCPLVTPVADCEDPQQTRTPNKTMGANRRKTVATNRMRRRSSC